MLLTSFIVYNGFVSNQRNEPKQTKEYTIKLQYCMLPYKRLVLGFVN